MATNAMSVPEHERVVDLVRRAVAAARRGDRQLGDAVVRVPSSRYLDPARAAAEERALFRGIPQPLGHVSELAEHGAVLVREMAGASLLVTREGDRIRAFHNACRHRGTRLLRGDTCAKAVKCPYHAWVYGLDGRLLTMPHADAFPGLDKAEHGLAEVPVEVRHGLVWARLDGGGAGVDVAAFLGPIDDELGTLGLDRHVGFRRVEADKPGNWKLLVEAFLESYHLRTLHKETIYPFFLDSTSVADAVGPHARHASVRRRALEPGSEAGPLRELATFAYFIFPATTVIFHPDFVSVVTVSPLGAEQLRWRHLLLVPHAPSCEAERAHWERSFQLIEHGVFQREDLVAVAEIQAGLSGGSLPELTFGLLEKAIGWFHAAVDARLG